MYKIFVFAPKDSTDDIINAMAKAGAGVIGNYTHCAYIIEGHGNWLSGEGSNPTIGEVGNMSREPENRIEMICPEDKLSSVIAAIKNIHPYESPEVDVVELHSSSIC